MSTPDIREVGQMFFAESSHQVFSYILQHVVRYENEVISSVICYRESKNCASALIIAFQMLRVVFSKPL